jgi:hypothetical protein
MILFGSNRGSLEARFVEEGLNWVGSVFTRKTDCMSRILALSRLDVDLSLVFGIVKDHSEHSDKLIWVFERANILGSLRRRRRRRRKKEGDIRTRNPSLVAVAVAVAVAGRLDLARSRLGQKGCVGRGSRISTAIGWGDSLLPAELIALQGADKCEPLPARFRSDFSRMYLVPTPADSLKAPHLAASGSHILVS